MIMWKIYYDDGNTYSNEDSMWEQAPIHGVLCVVVRDPTMMWGRWIYSGYSSFDHPGQAEYYVKHPDSDEPYSTHDLAPFLAKGSADMSMVKYGREADQHVWNETMRKAQKDPDFPKGSPRRRSTDFV